MIAPELDLVPRRIVLDGSIDVRFALRPGDRPLVADRRVRDPAPSRLQWPDR